MKRMSVPLLTHVARRGQDLVVAVHGGLQEPNDLVRRQVRCSHKTIKTNTLVYTLDKRQGIAQYRVSLMSSPVIFSTTFTPRETHVSSARNGKLAQPSERLTPKPSACCTQPAHDTIQSLSFRYVLSCSVHSASLITASPIDPHISISHA